MKKGKKIKFIARQGSIIPIEKFLRESKEKLFTASKSSLGSFVFCFIPFKEGDVGMVLQEKHGFSVWYLATTQEANSKVVSWTLKAVERHREWQGWTMTIINDIVPDASQTF